MIINLYVAENEYGDLMTILWGIKAILFITLGFFFYQIGVILWMLLNG